MNFEELLKIIVKLKVNKQIIVHCITEELTKDFISQCESCGLNRYEWL